MGNHSGIGIKCLFELGQITILFVTRDCLAFKLTTHNKYIEHKGN